MKIASHQPYYHSELSMYAKHWLYHLRLFFSATSSIGKIKVLKQIIKEKQLSYPRLFCAAHGCVDFSLFFIAV